MSCDVYADDELGGADEVVVEKSVEDCGTEFACGTCNSEFSHVACRALGVCIAMCSAWFYGRCMSKMQCL